MRDFSYTDRYGDRLIGEVGTGHATLNIETFGNIEMDARGCERLAKWLTKASKKLRALKAQPKRKHDVH